MPWSEVLSVTAYMSSNLCFSHSSSDSPFLSDTSIQPGITKRFFLKHKDCFNSSTADSRTFRVFSLEAASWFL